MAAYFAASQNQTLPQFVQGFPYLQYLKQVEITDFSALQADREFVWQKFGDGDVFLCALGEHFIKYFPVTADQIVPKIEIAELFLNARGKGITRANEDLYRVIGYYFLIQVASEIQKEIAAKRLDPNDPGILAIIQRLQRDKVYLTLEESTASKVLKHLWAGDFQLLIDRLRQKMGSKKTAPLAGGKLPASNLDVRLTHGFLSYQNRHRYRIYEISDNGARGSFGRLLIFERPYAQARYFAHNIFGQLNAYKQTHSVLLATTGGFTNNYSKPEGLSVENGLVVNAVLIPTNRDGLVIVLPDGGIRVINLKRRLLELPSQTGNNLAIENPIKSLMAYAQLLRWCRDEKATVFQTQLMAYSDNLLIDPNKAPPTPRERRLLALISDHRQRQTFYHVIFDIPTPQSLYDVSSRLFVLLREMHFKVEALLNLDTGNQNVLYVFDDKNRRVQEIHGTRDTTTNLLMYFSR